MEIQKIDVGGTSQAGVLLARRGQYTPQDDDYVYIPIIYHIAFHSLGSRLFDIREQQGLFYSAQGVLSYGVERDHPGMDIIATKVNISDSTKAITEIQKMIDKLRTNPEISDDELISAKHWYEHSLINMLNSPKNHKLPG